jgi:diguanylate cyclase (GGDEF)-like protein
VASWDEDTTRTAFVEAGDPGGQAAYLVVLSGSSVGRMFRVEEAALVIGRGSGVEVRLLDDGISRRHARVERQADRFFVEDLESKNGTFVNGERVARHLLADGDKIQVGESTFIKFTLQDQLDSSFQRRLYEAALCDGLTKIFNRKYFLDRLRGELAFATRHAAPLSLVMFDVDHFKRINDQHGHLAGDRVLVALARAVERIIRHEDVFARWGGEEFAVICRGIDLVAAHAFAERVRRIVAAAAIEHEGVRLDVTISVGVAAIPDDPTLAEGDALVRAADAALYRAKRDGRNRVVAHGR